MHSWLQLKKCEVFLRDSTIMSGVQYGHPHYRRISGRGSPEDFKSGRSPRGFG